MIMLMRRLITTVRHHPSRIGLLAVFIPLLLLLGFQYRQYRWMSKLGRSATAVREATANNFLEAVTSSIEWHYRSVATYSLNPRASYFVEGRLEKVAEHWARRPVEPARLLFLLDFTRAPEGELQVYDPVTQTLTGAAGDAAEAAAIAACSRYRDSGDQSDKPGGSRFRVDETDPRHRILCNPIRDDSLGTVGICGMILDEEYFSRSALPGKIDQALVDYFGESFRGAIGVEVLGQADRVVLSRGEMFDDAASRSRSVAFVFTDWMIRIDPGGYGLPDRSSINSTLNHSLSFILLAVLIVGTIWSVRAAGRAVRLSEMKADFVANVSHELRTPIASIRTFAEHLRSGRTGGGEQVRQYGEYIEAESQRLCRLTDRILDLSRIESGQQEHAMRPTALAAVVTETVRSFEAQTANDAVRISYLPPDQAPPLLDLDADAIARALDNLLDNAVKYSGPPDKVEVEVRLEQISGMIALRVRDRGIGIAREDLDLIFDRFHRVGSSLVHDVKGSGLGLSIVRQIIEAHGGKIEVESNPGEGSTFSLLFPYAGGG